MYKMFFYNQTVNIKSLGLNIGDVVTVVCVGGGGGGGSGGGSNNTSGASGDQGRFGYGAGGNGGNSGNGTYCCGGSGGTSGEVVERTVCLAEETIPVVIGACGNYGWGTGLGNNGNAGNNGGASSFGTYVTAGGGIGGKGGIGTNSGWKESDFQQWYNNRAGITISPYGYGNGGVSNTTSSARVSLGGGGGTGYVPFVSVFPCDGRNTNSGGNYRSDPSIWAMVNGNIENKSFNDSFINQIGVNTSYKNGLVILFWD